MKRKGTIWIITGLLLITAALCLTAYNVAADMRAKKAAEGIMTDLLPEVIDDPSQALPYMPMGTEMPVKIIDGREYVAIISIPSLDLELPVFSTWDYTKLQSAPCHFYGSVYTNDFVVCAHNYSRHFGQIKNLSMGDAVTVEDMNGNVFHYEVVGMETLNPTAVEDMIHGDDWDLTLFTCTIGGATRVTVRCALTA